MKFSEAIDLTLKQYGITGKELAIASGVSEGSISRYRTGKRDIQSESLEKMIAALPDEAQQFFYFHCLVSEMSTDSMALLLNAIASKMQSSTQTHLVLTSG